MQNPFNPSFDYNAVSYVWGNNIVRNIVAASQTTNNPWRTTFIMGLRGSGKTSTLTAAYQRLQDQCILIKTSATDSLLTEILQSIIKQLHPGMSVAEISLTIPGITMTLRKELVIEGTFQFAFSEVLQRVKDKGQQVVILLDEVQKANKTLEQFFTAYGHAISLGLPIMVVSAGLPSAIFDVINDEAQTFLLRANRVNLEPLDLAAVTEAYLTNFSVERLQVQDAQLMAKLSFGYPFLYQLIGHHVWRLSGQRVVTRAIIEEAAGVAKQSLFEQVYGKVFADLSADAKSLLWVMLESGLNKFNYQKLSKFLTCDRITYGEQKTQLYHWGILSKVAGGGVCFTLPYFRDFLAEQIE